MNAIEKIEAQQAGHENTPEWMVGQQLKDICRDPHCAELVEKDIDAITLARVAAKIKAWADEQHKKQHGKCICVPPNVAEDIIRKAYGLPDAGQLTEAPAQDTAPAEAPAQDDGFLDLSAFL